MPLPVALLPVGVYSHAVSVLLAVDPLAPVHSTVRPHKGALAMLHILLVKTIIYGSVRELHPAHPAHVAADPLPHVHATPGEAVAPIPVHLIVLELPLVLYPRTRLVDSHTVLATPHKLALVLSAVE